MLVERFLDSLDTRPEAEAETLWLGAAQHGCMDTSVAIWQVGLTSRNTVVFSVEEYSCSGYENQRVGRTHTRSVLAQLKAAERR